MSEILVTASGIVGTDPRHAEFESGAAVTSFRLASARRRRVQEEWVDGPTTWVTVTCWRQLAVNAHRSIEKGQRIVVQGRLVVRRWQTPDGKSGLNVEIEATGLGPDLTFGTSTFERTRRSDSFEPSAPPEAAATLAQVSLDGELVEGWSSGGAEDRPGWVDLDGVIAEDIDLQGLPEPGIVPGQAGPREGERYGVSEEELPGDDHLREDDLLREDDEGGRPEVRPEIAGMATGPEPVLAGGRTRRR